jgi:hypothetical protein
MIQSGMHGRSINECRSNDCRSNDCRSYMRFGTSDHIFNIHDVQLIIIFVSLTKIKDIVENLDELCFGPKTIKTC